MANFFDCIRSPSHSPLYNWAEEFLYFDGISENLGCKRYSVVQTQGQEEKIALTTVYDQSLALTALKIACLAILILPALIVKTCYRLTHHFKIIDCEKTPEVLKPPVDLPIAEVTEEELPEPLKLSETKGFENGGLSCYISACLQCLKNIPRFWTYLSKDLAREIGESDSAYKLRLDIQKQILSMLTQSKEGITVSSADSRKLRDLLNQFNPDLHAGGGNPIETWKVIVKVLKITTPQIRITENDGYSFEYDYANITVGLVNKENETWINLEGWPFVKMGDILAVYNSRFVGIVGVTIHFPLEVTLTCENVPTLYKLAGVTLEPPGHSIAFVRDQQLNEWVEFNDAKVLTGMQLDDRVRKQLHVLFYERM